MKSAGSGAVGCTVRGGVACAAALIALLAFHVGAAAAAKPTREQLQPFQFADVIDCGSFEDDFVDYFSGSLTTFYDANGDPVRLVFHIAHRSDDVNSLTRLTIHEHGHFTVTDDLVTGTETVTGDSEVANRPGMGVVVQDVGRAVFDANDELVFFAGGRNHSELFGGDQVLCEALG